MALKRVADALEEYLYSKPAQHWPIEYAALHNQAHGSMVTLARYLLHEDEPVRVKPRTNPTKSHTAQPVKPHKALRTAPRPTKAPKKAKKPRQRGLYE